VVSVARIHDCDVLMYLDIFDGEKILQEFGFEKAFESKLFYYLFNSILFL